MPTDYFHVRHGLKPPGGALSLDQLRSLIAREYTRHDRDGFFQKAFGFSCMVEQEWTPGTTGQTFRIQFLCETGYEMTWPPDGIRDLDEVGLFTFVEFAHRHIAKPVNAQRDPHCLTSSCELHYPLKTTTFSVAQGRKSWRAAMTPILRNYKGGYELTSRGEVCHLSQPGVEDLLNKPSPQAAPKNEQAIISRAVKKFRRGTSTREERKEAIETVYKIVERYREDGIMKLHFSKKDNKALFEIANEYAIRHYRRSSKDDYDDSFLDWLFYVLLATAHLVLDLTHGETNLQEQEDEEATA